MPKFSVWRSGSGHLNCWNVMPVYYGEYEANCFLDACSHAIEFLNKAKWTITTIDNVLYIESDETNEFGQKLGRYGFFQTQQDAMQETVRHFTTPQVLTDSIGNSALVDMCILNDDIQITLINYLD